LWQNKTKCNYLGQHIQVPKGRNRTLTPEKHTIVVVTHIVILPGTLWYLGTKIDNIFNLKKVPDDIQRTSRASLVTSSPVGDGNEETVPGGAVPKGPTTTGVAIKQP